ncbi:MAG: AAA family ATPase [Planctomycetota bacterium]
MDEALERSEGLVGSLAARLQGRGSDPPEVIETHISWVLLTRDRALKVKKPVRLPFADFGTLALRRALCEEEVRLNRRLAPDLYLGVVPIGGTHDAPVLGAEPAIEYAVEMRRFDSDQRLDRLLARRDVAPAELRRLAHRIGTFHGGLEPDVATRGSSAAVVGAALENFDELRDLPGAGSARLNELERWTRGECDRLADVFEARQRAGRVVEGHGDLHTENVARIEGELVPFDALEFSEALRWIDTMAEVGFLAMDLAVRGRRDLAYAFVDRYLETTGDHEGLRVLRFYVVYRAVVRAKVAAIGRVQRGEQPLREDDAHLAFARRAIARPEPLLVVTHGLSGSGKTTVTNELVGALPAVRARSDVERKRLFGLAADERSGSGLDGGLYTREASAATYDRLEECAAAALDGGVSVIVDATFLRRAERDRFTALAASKGAGAVVLACTAPEEALRERVAGREAEGRDASEATVEVLEHQLRSVERVEAGGPERAVVVDTTRPLDVAALARELAQTWS